MLTLAHGRSSGETKRPAETRSSGCVESSDRASAPARSRPSAQGVRFSTRSATSKPPSGSELRGQPQGHVEPRVVLMDFARLAPQLRQVAPASASRWAVASCRAPAGAR